MKAEDHLQDIDVVKIASDLIKIPGFSASPPYEQDVAEYIRCVLETEGVKTQLIEVETGRPNVIATLPGHADGRSLMLCGHMDTVPVYDMQEPFSGRVEHGVLYGRGACDMKGALAAMLAAFIAIHRSGMQLNGDLEFVGVIDEEEMGKGIDHLATHGPRTDGAVIGEPTSLRLAIGHKGLEWMRINVIGKKVHGGRMETGINAVNMAARLIDTLEKDYVPLLNSRKHPILGYPTLNVGRIEGGDQPSTVPGKCSLEIDRRWVPSETLDQVYGELAEILARLEREDNRFHAELCGYFSPDENPPHKPFCTQATDALVCTAQNAMRDTGLSDVGVTCFPAWSDAGTLAERTKTQCIVIGPGDLALAHTADESINILELEKAAHLYASLAIHYCGRQG